MRAVLWASVLSVTRFRYDVQRLAGTTLIAFMAFSCSWMEIK